MKNKKINTSHINYIKKNNMCKGDIMEDKEKKLDDLYNLIDNLKYTINELNDVYYINMLDSLKVEAQQEIDELKGE